MPKLSTKPLELMTWEERFWAAWQALVVMEDRAETAERKLAIARADRLARVVLKPVPLQPNRLPTRLPDGVRPVHGGGRLESHHA